MRIFLMMFSALVIWGCSQPDNTEQTASKTPQPEATNAVDTVDTAQAVQDTTPTAPYEAITWKMFSFSLDGENYRPYKDTLVTLELINGKAKGTGGCNQFSANYEADENGSFSITDFSASHSTCANLMGMESRYFKVLKEATAWKIDRMVLEVSGPSGKIEFLNMSAPRVRIE